MKIGLNSGRRSAREAFTRELQLTAVVNAVAAIVTAVVGWLLLRRSRPAPS